MPAARLAGEAGSAAPSARGPRWARVRRDPAGPGRGARLATAWPRSVADRPAGGRRPSSAQRGPRGRRCPSASHPSGAGRARDTPGQGPAGVRPMPGEAEPAGRRRGIGRRRRLAPGQRGFRVTSAGRSRTPTPTAPGPAADRSRAPTPTARGLAAGRPRAPNSMAPATVAARLRALNSADRGTAAGPKARARTHGRRGPRAGIAARRQERIHGSAAALAVRPPVPRNQDRNEWPAGLARRADGGRGPGPPAVAEARTRGPTGPRAKGPSRPRRAEQRPATATTQTCAVPVGSTARIRAVRTAPEPARPRRGTGSSRSPRRHRAPAPERRRGPGRAGGHGFVAAAG
jgi:hypothetical protein